MRRWARTERRLVVARVPAVPLLAAAVLAAVLTASPAMAVLAPAAPGAAPAALPSSAALPVNAWGGGLVDAETGVLVWGSDVNVARPMGSITKVMTALLVIRAGDLGREIKVTKGAVRYVGRRGARQARASCPTRSPGPGSARR
jgi:serine-type D-Ala-D-Ala carboxypeptidase (penicillin-binding protein 5/6)